MTAGTPPTSEIFPLFFDIAWRLGCNMDGFGLAVACSQGALVLVRYTELQ